MRNKLPPEIEAVMQPPKKSYSDSIKEIAWIHPTHSEDAVRWVNQNHGVPFDKIREDVKDYQKNNSKPYSIGGSEVKKGVPAMKEDLERKWKQFDYAGDVTHPNTHRDKDIDDVAKNLSEKHGRPLAEVRADIEPFHKVYRNFSPSHSNEDWKTEGFKPFYEKLVERESGQPVKKGVPMNKKQAQEEEEALEEQALLAKLKGRDAQPEDDDDTDASDEEDEDSEDPDEEGEEGENMETQKSATEDANDYRVMDMDEVLNAIHGRLVPEIQKAVETEFSKHRDEIAKSVTELKPVKFEGNTLITKALNAILDDQKSASARLEAIEKSIAGLGEATEVVKALGEQVKTDAQKPTGKKDEVVKAVPVGMNEHGDTRAIISKAVALNNQRNFTVIPTTLQTKLYGEGNTDLTPEEVETLRACVKRFEAVA